MFAGLKENWLKHLMGMSIGSMVFAIGLWVKTDNPWWGVISLLLLLLAGVFVFLSWLRDWGREIDSNGGINED